MHEKTRLKLGACSESAFLSPLYGKIGWAKGKGNGIQATLLVDAMRTTYQSALPLACSLIPLYCTRCISRLAPFKRCHVASDAYSERCKFETGQGDTDSISCTTADCITVL